MTDILNWCEDSGKAYWEYVTDVEDDPYLIDYLEQVWQTMQDAVERGLLTEGRLPGPLISYKSHGLSTYSKKSRIGIFICSCC